MAKAGKPKKPANKKMAGGLKAASGIRRRKLTKRQLRQEAKKAIQKRRPPPGSFRLTWQVLGTLKKFWKPLGGIVLVYLILNIIFASGISNLSTAVGNIKSNLNTTSGVQNHTLALAFSGFASLVGSAGASGSSTGSVLQSALIVLESLVIIWALRQLLAGQKIGVKQAYYQSTSQLIPFMLVILVIILQLLPLTVGAAAFQLVQSSLVGSSGVISAFLVILFCLLAAWSFYMVSGSVFALYIVTLPGMHPRKALRSAKNLVRFRRFAVLRRVLFLPIFIFVVMAVLIMPAILTVVVLAAPLFYLLGMLAILFIHTYLYSLYRALLE